MKFIKGLVLGLLVGFSAGAAMTERQRRDAAEKIAAIARRRSRPIVDSVAENVGQVADTATGVATSSIDDVGDAVSERIEAADSTAVS